MIIIRADGGKGIGMGHLMRTSVLAKKLADKYKVIYICDEKYSEGKEFLKEKGFECILARNPLEEILTHTAQCIITDSYQIDTNYIEQIRNKFPIVGYFDDNVLKEYKADFIINQNFGAEHLDYSKCKVKDLLLGTKYLLIRDEFREKIRKGNIESRLKQEEQNKHILVTVGGSDVHNYTDTLLNLVQHLDYTFHVVIGKIFPYYDQLVKKYGKNEKIVFELNADMADLMSKCDLAISSCGSTLYELGVLKVPVIGYVLADNQCELAERMFKEELIEFAGSINAISGKDLERLIQELLNNDEKRERMSNKCKQLLNPFGANEITKYIYRVLDVNC